ncbi:CE1759 family FMN reductase [Curtobacterium ammoniigenes]|uniref:CE1759 family FMN reductase n=1 Tax=Curtobacterium ammoniigenes TaxID=395387 RepID=UPI0009F83193|nr:CE1759 family FMN reductase [Curtobacterium ammoniigenes]
MTTIAVVSAGLSQPSSSRRLADRLADAAAVALDRADRAGGASRRIDIDLRPLAHDIVEALLTGRFGPELERAVREVQSADALVFVTPVFSAGISGVAKSFLDVLPPDAVHDLPTLLGATGGSARHSLALEQSIRPVFAYLRASVAPTAVFVAPEDWSSAGAAPLEARIRRAGDDLAWLVGASRRSRAVLPAWGDVEEASIDGTRGAEEEGAMPGHGTSGATELVRATGA